MVRNFVIASVMVATATVGLPSRAVAHDGERGWHQRGNDDGDYDDEDEGDNGGRYYRERGYYQDRGYYQGRGYDQDYGQPYYGNNRSYYGYSQPRYRCRTKGTTGLIVGGAAGALLGRGITRDRTTGAILGGAVGALLGRQVARSNRC
jgi:glycine zipper 2TM protein